METTRSRRSQVPVCYKEDSFVEEDAKKTPKTRGRSRKSLAVQQTNDGEAFNPMLSPIKLPFETLRISTPSKCANEVVPVTKLDENVSKRRGRPRKSVVITEERPREEAEITGSLKVATPRRGHRMRKKTAIALEAEQASGGHKQMTVDSGSDSSDEFAAETLERPTDLFGDGDVEGKKMFGFKVSHRKNNLLKKAIETALLDSPKRNKEVSTPRTPKTPAGSIPGTPKRRGRPPSLPATPKSAKILPMDKTPHHLRKKMTKKLQNLVKSDSEGSDFSDSGSDFQPSESSDDDDDHDIQSDDSVKSAQSDSDEESVQVKKMQKTSIQNSQNSYGLRNRRGKNENFFIKSDDYFTNQGSKKIVTSNRTLDRLKNPRMTEDKLQNILKNQSISKEHREAINELLEDHRSLFDRWIFALSEGFSLLLYGVGSKLKLVQEFQRAKLSSHPCVVVNGFFPSLTLKDILDSIILDALELDSVPANVNDAIEVIQEEMASMPSVRLFVLIHNIDGPMLKSAKVQHFLSKVSRMGNVHLIATLDHANGPLVWDHMKLRDYNFSWWDVTTFLSYAQETSFESSLLVHKSGALALSSLQNVFHSLTTNAKGIFMLIAKNQLKNKKTPHYQGLSFKELYWSARESFLVSSDLALRAQLTEFLDHKLVRNKRTLDGVENLVIPIENSLLQQFIDQNESA